MPIETQVFRRARIVKNARLDSAIEFFRAAGSGRGQIEIRNVAKFLALEQTPPHPDVQLLQTVAACCPALMSTAFAFCCAPKVSRSANSSALTLSPAKIASLSSYMAVFTRPLIKEIFGRDTEGAQFQDIVGMFRTENPAAVRERLATMADRFGISIDAIPKFLEDYGDIFTSLSFYRQCLDHLLPQVQGFMDGMAMIRANHQLAQDRSLMEAVDTTEETVNGMLSNITGKIESFERSTNDMWRELSAENFRKIEALISQYHTSVGGALCAMSVKINAWTDQFPDNSGGVGRRAAFLMSDMRQGIEKLQSAQRRRAHAGGPQRLNDAWPP